jgi:DNA invertase Pin-like site-specific DNA recombinase
MSNQQAGLAGPLTQEATTSPEKVKYVLYARKSTESDEKQALSIDSQVKEMLQISERDGLEVIDIRREAHSAKDSAQRPVFNEILKDIRDGRFSGILTWAPDRLSRNAGDLGSLVDLMDQNFLIEIRTFGQKFTNSPNEKFLLMILGSQAKLENDNKSVNVKRGLRMRCEMGLWPAPAPTGYLNEKRIDRKGHIMVDPERAPIIKQMFEKMAYEHWSGRKIYHWLKFDLNFKSSTTGKNLTLSNIYLLLQTTFYYGVFEYPAKSGNWYTGKHTPIISKELFDEAQKQLKRDRITRGESKEFAFTKLMTCGLCGSGISAEEKYKQLKDGTTAKYIYYGCSRARDKNCKGGYMREEEAIDQLVKIMDKLDISEIGMRHKFEEEVARLDKFHKSILKIQGIKAKAKDVDLRDYAKYVLREGSSVEKRELLALLQSRLIYKDKRITLLQ